MIVFVRISQNKITRKLGQGVYGFGSLLDLLAIQKKKKDKTFYDTLQKPAYSNRLKISPLKKKKKNESFQIKILGPVAQS